jgi:hypothetical protein
VKGSTTNNAKGNNNNMKGSSNCNAKGNNNNMNGSNNSNTKGSSTSMKGSNSCMKKTTTNINVMCEGKQATKKNKCKKT